MIERKVKCVKRDEDGDITHIGNRGEWWSPRKKADAIRDIESENYSYYVMVNYKKVNIHVVDGSTGKYLRTDPDATTKNNLDDLPDC